MHKRIDAYAFEKVARKVAAALDNEIIFPVSFALTVASAYDEFMLDEEARLSADPDTKLIREILADHG